MCFYVCTHDLNLGQNPCLLFYRRREESIHETLAETFPKLFSIIGNFVTDNEMKLLLKTFLVNSFDETSALSVRRNAALTLTCVCVESRKPAVFLPWLLSTMLDGVLPIDR